MPQPVFDDDDAEVLREPRAVPTAVWVVAAVLLAVLVGAVAVDHRHDRRAPHALPSGSESRRGSRSPTGRPSAPVATSAAPNAADVLVAGRSSGFSAGSGRIVFETDVVNTSPSTVTVRYPITVLGPRHTVLPGAHAALHERGPSDTAVVGIDNDQPRLVVLSPGATAALVVDVPADCRHPGAQPRWGSSSLQAVVRVSPAVGVAKFGLDNVGLSFADLVRTACMKG